jgi:hypothetical protein
MKAVSCKSFLILATSASLLVPPTRYQAGLVVTGVGDVTSKVQKLSNAEHASLTYIINT